MGVQNGSVARQTDNLVARRLYIPAHLHGQMPDYGYHPVNADEMTKAIAPIRRPAPARFDRCLLAIMLNARRSQAGKTVLIDRVLPGKEFLDCQRVTAAGLLKREKSAAHGSDDFGLAPDDPALRAGRWQISNSQRASIRPDNILGPRSKGLSHEELTH